MLWNTRGSSLPAETTKVGIELIREIEDEETGELLEEHIIDVTGRFFPEDNSVGLGSHVEVISAFRTFPGPRTEVELTDEEVDSLVDLLEEQRRS
tara:strand:+ start:320 stop:604 length:285 start_codon:yes stop_codon:yes gene_type:complete